MDLARSLDVLAEFTLEVAQQRTLESFQTFLTALQASANQPSHAALEETMKNQLKAFLMILSESPSNAWPPARRRLLEELGLANSTGTGLLRRVQEVLNSEALTKAIAVQRASQLLESVRSTVNSATQLVNGFNQLGIKPGASTTAECEVAILIPPPQNKDNLEFLDSDLEQFNRLLKLVNELSGEGGLSPRVTGLSSGSWEIYLELGLRAAKTLVDIVSKIIVVRRSVGSLRSKTEGLKGEKGVPSELLETLEELARANTESGLHEIAEETVTSSVFLDDDGRRREITTAVRRSVRYLAKRLDEGVRVEVSPPKALSEAMKKGREPQDIAKLQEALDALIREAPMIANMEEVEAPVLSLPEPDGASEEIPERSK